jgi:hypothetical protein
MEYVTSKGHEVGWGKALNCWNVPSDLDIPQ